jgi:rubrerythrin
MTSIKGTQTEKNVLTAFTGESAARNRYTYWAAQAKKEGFVQIEAIFEETANQEKEHAKRLFKFLEGGEVQVSIGLPAGVIGKTMDNLNHAAEGEEYEWQHMYPTSPKSPGRKASKRSPKRWRASRWPRSSTANATARWPRTSRKASFSSATIP